MVAYGRGDSIIDKEHMRVAVKDTDDAQLKEKTSTLLSWVFGGTLVAALAGLAGFLALVAQ